MKLRLLSLAYEDLLAGRDFYEMQQAGLGTYCLDTLFSDIESLLVHAGVHAKHFGYYPRAVKSLSLRDLLQARWRTHRDLAGA